MLLPVERLQAQNLKQKQIVLAHNEVLKVLLKDLLVFMTLMLLFESIKCVYPLTLLITNHTE